MTATKLPDPRKSQVVLIGVSEHTDPRLPGYAAMRTGVEALARLLKSHEVWGVPESQCRIVTGKDATRENISAALLAAAEAAEDALVVYYGGHGVLDRHGTHTKLLLAPRPASYEHTLDWMDFDWLRSHLQHGAPMARHRILLLDCCHSGEAINRGALGGPPGPWQEDDRANLSTLITSCEKFERAHVPESDRYSVFVAALVNILTLGMDGIGGVLTPEHVHSGIDSQIGHRQKPRILCADGAGNAPLFKNRRCPAEQATTPEANRSVGPGWHPDPADPGGQQGGDGSSCVGMPVSAVTVPSAVPALTGPSASAGTFTPDPPPASGDSGPTSGHPDWIAIRARPRLRRKHLWIAAAIGAFALVLGLVLGSIFLLAILANWNGDPLDEAVVGQCVPYDAREVVTCDDDTAFWEITALTREINATVDDSGELTDYEAAYDLCGEGNGAPRPGELRTNSKAIYNSGGEVDALYCLRALGNPDPASDARAPYFPGEGDCTDDRDATWTVDCESPEAFFEVVDTIEFDKPQELSDEEVAEAGKASCSSGLYYKELRDRENRVTVILCSKTADGQCLPYDSETMNLLQLEIGRGRDWVHVEGLGRSGRSCDHVQG
jgi:hypothetical protein